MKIDDVGIKIDESDRKIIQTISENAKLSYRQVAQKTGLSVVTVMKRIKRLEESGVIKGYHTILDYEKMGFDVFVIVNVRVTKGRSATISDVLRSRPNVYRIFDVTGSFDMLILCRFKSSRELDRFLKELQNMPNVERSETRLILNVMK